MIQFFRKLRQRLLTENKFSKYLAYALGEIILVVIGILIALSINNRNDLWKNSETEQIYYCRIMEDFNLDKQLIGQLLEKADTRVAISKELLLELDSGTRDKHYLLNNFLRAIRSDAYVPRNVTYQDLISSGNIKLLRDIPLKNSLIQYFSELENKQYQMRQNRDEGTKRIFELINSSIDFGGVQEFEYVHQILGPEVLSILPKVDWIHDKSSAHYRHFQQVLLFNIAMADREKQHLHAIHDLMAAPFSLLQNKCSVNEQ